MNDSLLRQRLARWPHKYRPTKTDVAYGRMLLVDPCAYCGGNAGCIDHIDHARNGWDNLTAACKRCNTAKGQHTLLRDLLAIQLRKDRELLTAQIKALGESHGPRPKHGAIRITT